MRSGKDPAAQAVLELLFYRLRHYVCTLELSEDAVAKVDEVVGQLTSLLAPSAKVVLGDEEKFKKEVRKAAEKLGVLGNAAPPPVPTLRLSLPRCLELLSAALLVQGGLGRAEVPQWEFALQTKGSMWKNEKN